MVIKNICPQEDMSTFNMVAEQSPTSVQHVESNLDHRYQSLHRRRQFEYDRNLITSSPKYQAYRAKQRKNEKGAKWPEILEGPFLDGNQSPRALRSFHSLIKPSLNRCSCNGKKKVFF